MTSIVFFLYSLDIGGTEKVLVQLANYFAGKNYKVTILTVSDSNHLTDLIDKKVQISSLGRNTIKSAFFPLIKYVKESDIDYFISNVWPLTLISILILLFVRKTKLLLIEHGILSEEFKDHGFFFRKLQTQSINLFYKFADNVIAVSEGVKQDLVNMGVRSSKIAVIYNPLFEPDIQAKYSYPKSLESWLSSSSKKLISIGRLKESKNFPNLVRAISSFHKKYSPQLKLLILGEGEERNNLETLIEKEGLKDHIFLPGWIKDPYPFLEKADLFVLSSDYEGFGLVIAEAMYTGTTVVSTDCVSGPREILKNGELGYLCEVNNPDELADCIDNALNNPIDKKKLIDRAKDFSITNIGKQYQELLTKGFN